MFVCVCLCDNSYFKDEQKKKASLVCLVVMDRGKATGIFSTQSIYKRTYKYNGLQNKNDKKMSRNIAFTVFHQAYGFLW